MSAPPSYELPKNMYGVSFNRESAYKHIPIVNADIANKSLFLFIFIAPEIYNSLALLFFFHLLPYVQRSEFFLKSLFLLPV